VRVGTPREAAAFGEVVLVSVPYMSTPQIGRDLRSELAGKIVLDTGNPYPQRDGAMAEEARRKGTGVASAEFLPGTRLVRAFNAINSNDLESEAHRKGDRVAIPLAGDDAEALAVAERLVRDAGFDPVVVGPLSRAREFDVGTNVYTRLLTAPQLRKELGLAP
jgi:predicted dinucleotide-binding enzyme